MSVSASGLSAADLGMPSASSFESATRTGRSNYLACVRSGYYDTVLNYFVWTKGFHFYYEPIRIDTSRLLYDWVASGAHGLDYYASVDMIVTGPQPTSVADPYVSCMIPPDGQAYTPP